MRSTAAPVPDTSRRASPAALAALWHDFQATGDPHPRNRLIMSLAPLVRVIVFKRVPSLPPHCDVDDLLSAGLEALIGAVDRWDPEGGASLDQYAWIRIQGAVVDELRRQDWAPRSVRRRERDVTQARSALAVRLHRDPTREEVAGHLGLAPADLHRHETDVFVAELGSLEHLLAGGDADVCGATGDPVGEAERSEAKARFREAFARLGAREREVAVLLYVKQATLAEIGEQLGVSESRVCQIHGELKRRLRRELQPDEALFDAVG